MSGYGRYVKPLQGARDGAISSCARRTGADAVAIGSPEPRGRRARAHGGLRGIGI